ncbi:hypothetical protein DMC63_37720 [Streptomyces sp. WAC 05977]|nr:hypothetical protein DMC63_37720 [Streptomyces sp. WAC 05977]
MAQTMSEYNDENERFGRMATREEFGEMVGSGALFPPRPEPFVGTPLQELHRTCGLTHHQTRPLHQHGITTVERLAGLVDAHRANPDGSELSAVAGFGRARIELACTAIDRWRGSTAGLATSSRRTS